MKPFVSACVVAIIIAIIGSFALNAVQEPAAKAFSTTSVRLGT